MSLLVDAKQLSISVGLYKPMRRLYRILSWSDRRHFDAHRLLLGEFIRERDLAFDVGANIGNRTEILLSLGASVVAFELQPMCAREIAARGNKHLTVVHMVVGEAEATARLHLNANHLPASLMLGWPASNDAGVMAVPVTTLDKAIEQFGFSIFCKMDVERLEPQVLHGLSRSIPALSFEYHCDECGIEQVRECLTCLSDPGNYCLNFIGCEVASFLSTERLAVPKFMKSFPPRAKRNFWGDLFAVAAT